MLTQSIERKSQKYFMVPRADIEAEGYDLSLSRYKEDVFEEVEYETPGVILERLLQEEVGEVEDDDLAKVQSGIVRELIELRGMVG
jgi:type I restriction enzyme M protein